MKTIKSRVLTTLILLILAVICVINTTYSYFTSTASTNGNIVFSDLNVRFAYQIGQETLPTDKTTITLYPSTGTIQREIPFQLATTEGGSAIDKLIIHKYGATCACYVRFWIDAYVLKETIVGNETIYEIDESVNYGKYFFLATNENVYTKTGGSVSGSWCYFVKSILRDNSSVSLDLGNTLVLKDISTNEVDKVPVSLLGERLKITLTLESVQATNKAYLSVFGAQGDPHGYYSSWR